MIELSDEMERAYDDAAWENPVEHGGTHMADVRAGLAAVLAIVERDYVVAQRARRLPVWPGYEMPAAPTCYATIDTKGTVVRCTKKPDGHDTHLARHCGWDVIW